MRLAQYLRAKALWPRRAELPPTDDPIRIALRETGEQLAQEMGASKPRTISQAGIDLIHSFESCAQLRADGTYQAYPDPGSVNGEPWTIGWGSTGRDIGPTTVWTKQQCDERFARDIERYTADVREAIGDTPTTQPQFDAMVSFHYNTGAIKKATLTKLHNKGDHRGAADQFLRWVFNDGRRMRGLVRRREAERALYLS